MKFAVIGLNHGHVYSQIDGLLKLGSDSQCVGFFAPESDLCDYFSKRYPTIPWRSREELLRDPDVELIVSASINADRGPLAADAMYHGKHFFVDKPACTTLADIQTIRHALSETGKQLFVYFSERLGNPLEQKAKQIVDSGEIGKIAHVMGLGPHKLVPDIRPAWMWDTKQYGGILNDIASHQIDWFVWLTGSRIKSFTSRVGHYDPRTVTSFEDFGDATLVSESGATGYVRVDWLTPEKLPAFGDVRGVIVGTKGTIEIRRQCNIAATDPKDTGPHMILTTHEKPPHRIDAGEFKNNWAQLIAESIRTDTNKLNDHATVLHVMEMCVKIQTEAKRIN